MAPIAKIDARIMITVNKNVANSSLSGSDDLGFSISDDDT